METQGDHALKKFRLQQSAGKIMPTGFLGLKSCSDFRIHATQENQYLEAPVLPQ